MSSAVRLVLLRPRNADNLGAIARAMKNFGLTDWVVVSPNPNLIEGPGLNRLAVKAGDLLETVRRVETLEEAVSDCTLVVGTTMRMIEGRRRLSPREVARQHASEGGRTAIVFGDERSGMTNDDLKQCHALSVIPTADAQPSLNLSQAVVVYAYEVFAAEFERQAPPPEAVRADDALLRRVGEQLTLTLNRSGFLQDDGRGGHLPLMQSLVRSRLSRKEAQLWMAALGSVLKDRA